MANDGSATSPVSDLADAFGDPKLPEISRKITACVACRKQKVREEASALAVETKSKR
jgi:hypothetical protein